MNIFSQDNEIQVSLTFQKFTLLPLHFLERPTLFLFCFPGSSDGKVSVYNAGDPGSIPGLGRSPGEENGNPLHIPAWKIPWTKEPGGLQSMGSLRVGHD